jgi:ribosomal protein L44E
MTNSCALNSDDASCEDIRYLAKLMLRLEEGSGFAGKFVLSNRDKPTVRYKTARALYYECEKCVITSCAITVQPNETLRARINFVTTGPFELRYNPLPGYLLQEDTDLLLQETSYPIDLLDDETD